MLKWGVFRFNSASGVVKSHGVGLMSIWRALGWGVRRS